MWDFKISQALGLMMRTMPFIVLRLIIYFGITLAYVLVTGVGAGLGWGVGAMGGADFQGTSTVWGGIFGFGITAAVLYFLREYILYMVKAAHIAVIVELLDGGEIPGGQNQVMYGQKMVKERFAQANVLFAIDQIVKGVLRAVMGLVRTITSIIPIPGLQQFIGLVRAFLNIAVGFLDEVILGYSMKTKSENPWASARTALVLYGQNYKVMLKNAAWLTVIIYGLTFVLFLLLLAPAGAIAYMFPGSLSAFGIVIALLLAWSLKSALLEPLAITCMMQVYFPTIEGQTPNPEWEQRLNDLSKKFRELGEKAASWVGGRTGGMNDRGTPESAPPPA